MLPHCMQIVAFTIIVFPLRYCVYDSLTTVGFPQICVAVKTKHVTIFQYILGELAQKVRCF